MDLNIAIIYNNLGTNENECEDEAKRTRRTKRIRG